MLSLSGVTKHFGGLTAVNRVNLTVGTEAVTGLVGPNGSGKTTLFHVITGFYRTDAGQIRFENKPIHGLRPYQISRRGIVRTFQNSRPLPFLSVIDNLLAAVPHQEGETLFPLFFRPGRIRRAEEQNRRRAEEVLAVLQLSAVKELPAARISYGQQKLLELGRVLMTRPRLVLLDEPTAGVNPTLIRGIVSILSRLAETGIRFFVIEHNMPLMAEICSRLIVMDAGRVIFEGAPAEARTAPGVIDAYLGKQG